MVHWHVQLHILYLETGVLLIKQEFERSEMVLDQKLQSKYVEVKLKVKYVRFARVY